MPQTKGRLTSGQIKNLSTGEIAYFMFNPSEYTISKSNSYQPQSKKGKNTPKFEFKQGGAATLKLQLFFDTYMDVDRVDVRTYTEILWKMMYVDKTEQIATTEKSDPPHVEFKWGTVDFRAVITSMSEKFTLFSERGTPLRSTVDISLQQVEDPEDFSAQAAVVVRPDLASSQRATISARLEQIAASSLGSPSAYRAIAEASNIDDPLSVAPGTPLSVPSTLDSIVAAVQDVASEVNAAIDAVNEQVDAAIAEADAAINEVSDAANAVADEIEGVADNAMGAADNAIDGVSGLGDSASDAVSDFADRF